MTVSSTHLRSKFLKFYNKRVALLILTLFFCGTFLPAALAQSFGLIGTKLIREMDSPKVDPTFTQGYHLEVYLEKLSGASAGLTITDYAIGGTRHASMPDVSPGEGGVTTGKYWLCSPNPAGVGEMVLLRIRLAQGATTFPTLGNAYTLTLYFDDTTTQDITISPAPTDIWMPFVHIDDNLRDLTIYVGNMGSGSITLPAGGGLKINNASVTASLPSTTLAPGDVVPVSATLPGALPEYGRFLLEVSNAAGTESAWGSMRAIKSSYGTTVWSYNSNNDTADMARHYMDPNIPGRAAFRDEPFGGSMTPQTLADLVEASWQNDSSRVVMNQYTGKRENQVYAGLNDIQMNHHQDEELDLALHLTWPHPVWYLPQTLWARTENAQNPTSPEEWYRPDFMRRESYEALGHGAKVLHWFIHQNLWWQGFIFGGGGDMHRGKQDLYFHGAIANPVIWDRAGRVSAMMHVIEPFLKDSAPGHTVLDGNDIEINTVITPEANRAVILAVDKATDLHGYYRAGAPSANFSLYTFSNVTLEATVPTWLTADKAYIVDMFDGVSEIAMSKSGSTVSFTLPELREAACIVLGTSADLSTLESRWNTVSADFATANYGDDGIGSLEIPQALVLPTKWLHRLASSEKTYSMDLSPDGSLLLVGSGHFARMIDTDSREILWEQSYTGRVFYTRFSPDGTLFYVSMNTVEESIGSYTGTAIKGYDTATQTEQWQHDSYNTILHMETGFADNGVAYTLRDSEDPSRVSVVRKLDSSGNVDWSTRDLGWGNYANDFAVSPAGVTYMGNLNLTRLSASGSTLFGGNTYRDFGSYHAACGISDDGKLVAMSGNKLFLYKNADTSTPAVFSTRPYLGRDIRKIAILKNGSLYYVAAGTCDGIFKIFSVDTSTNAVTEIVESTNPRSMVSDIIAMPNNNGFVMAHEIFAYTVDTMWRWRDEVIGFDLAGNELFRNEGRWRPQPYMTELAMDDAATRMAVMAGTDVRFIELPVQQIPNSETPEEPLYYLPPPWENVDVGGVDSPGSADFSPITQSFTCYGSGNWWNQSQWSGTPIGTNTADEFNFTYLEITGDVTITARISDFQDAGAYCTGGLMVRETLDPGSKYYAQMYFNRQPDKNLVLIRENTGQSGFSRTVADAPKAWLRVERSGNIFTSYISDDGVTWGSAQAVYTLSMNSTVYVGLVANADTFNYQDLVRVSYDNVDVQAAGVEAQGAIRAALRPAGAVAAGAQWMVEGQTGWLSSNDLAAVSPGTHNVIFSDTAGYVKPSPISVTVPAAGWYDNVIGSYSLVDPASSDLWILYSH